VLLKINRFNEIRRSLPGLMPRVLIMRLHELEGLWFIEPVAIKDKPRIVEWILTEKGRDTIPILMSIIFLAQNSMQIGYSRTTGHVPWTRYIRNIARLNGRYPE
jgi:DNA-binding HxlR family transcriptional regulator